MTNLAGKREREREERFSLLYALCNPITPIQCLYIALDIILVKRVTHLQHHIAPQMTTRQDRLNTRKICHTKINPTLLLIMLLLVREPYTYIETTAQLGKEFCRSVRQDLTSLKLLQKAFTINELQIYQLSEQTSATQVVTQVVT